MLVNPEKKQTLVIGAVEAPTLATLIEREAALRAWLTHYFATSDYSLTALPRDASFRRYFRVQHGRQRWIAMDAPPLQENCQSFVDLALLFRRQGLTVPEIFLQDLQQGFLLLSDFGADLYFKILDAHNATHLYPLALQSVLRLQSETPRNAYPFLDFAPLLQQELQLFRHWYLDKHVELALSAAEENMLAELFQLLADSANEQPQVCVHRDYHSRNLMLLPDNQVGILDFQDAVWGPITYDVVSLIRDCYVAWPDQDVKQWSYDYFQAAQAANLIPGVDFAQWQRWLDWMGIQRHLKALFIFARKWHRDQNPNYLSEIPRTFNYVLTVSAQYPELKAFHLFWRNRLL